jgi:imidazole glycerol-phosphate synthase subunit HisF
VALPRIIARLDIKGSSLVKGVHLEGLRVLGTPWEFARRYGDESADELLYVDVVASLYERNSLTAIIERTANEIAIPLTVAGGLRHIDDIRRVLRSGADKVAINTAALRRPEFVSEAAEHFGSSTIVVSIEARRSRDGTFEALANAGRDRTGINAVEWAVRAAELGAGEILVTSVDREGTGRGFDLDLTRQIAAVVPIPVIASGGAGTARHVIDVLRQGSADAVAVATLIHYDGIQRHKNQPVDSIEGNVDFLRSGRVPQAIQPVSMRMLKESLTAAGVDVRMS